MTKIPFKISARTAKLIGRENFSNSEGAIIELVKNSYDADAKNCLVLFDIKYDSIPSTITVKEYNSFVTEKALIKQSYSIKKGAYFLGNSLNVNQIEVIREFFFSKNSIYIIDNGHGMTKDIVENQWMMIGTGNKEITATSIGGRVLTGAKGIGRFAMDRLGFFSEMLTVSKVSKKGCSWKMDWKQFDEGDKKLSDIDAEIDDVNIDIKNILKTVLKGKPRILNQVNKINFSHGTIIKISNLKDNWFESRLENVFKSLEALVPPKELKIPFKFSFFSFQDTKLYGDVETAFFDDFDYKIEAFFDAKKLNVEMSITRDELDMKEVKANYSSLFQKASDPYDLTTLAKKTFHFRKSIFEILRWEKGNDNSKLLSGLGSFSFTFYFLKNLSSKEYPYRHFSVIERQKVLRKFGGIKIYRDSFRVRPYGDIGNDWLKLGDRAAQSPAGAGQRIGDWRVGPNQVAGLVKISRLTNPNLIDKSDRGSLIENESFNALKSIVTDIINYFEVDRSIILNRFFLDKKEKENNARNLQIRQEAEKLADEIIKERNKVERKIYGRNPDLFSERKTVEEKQAFQRIIETGFQNIEKKADEDAELAQVRTLASLGIIVTSFAHELKDIKNNLDELEKLVSIFNKLISKEGKLSLDFMDAMDIFELLKSDNLKISHWVKYSLTAIKKDKRKRGILYFDKYFSSLSSMWAKLLEDRNIVLDIKGASNRNYAFRAFEMDMNTIFNNLISNSIESFNKLKVIRKRVITIRYKIVADKMQILYSDNGAGLAKIFAKNVDEIFLPFVTAKKDREGNDIGTGLGMYLIKTVIDDNGGIIKILKPGLGFQVQIELPIKKSK